MNENRRTPLAHIRRPGTLAVHSLDHFEMEVPDLDVAEHFYRAFGLDVRRDTCALGLYVPNNPQRWATLQPGPRKHLRKIGFRAYPEDLAALRERITQLGLRLEESNSSNIILLRDPDGLLVQISAGERLAPDRKASFVVNSAAAGEQSAWSRATAPTFTPQRLSHIAMFCSDVDRSIDFYQRTLGLAVADRSGSILAFMHGVHGSDHHILALAKSAGPGLHHCSWDMGSIDAIELAAARMIEAGYAADWGLGRHVLGSNYFHYIRDPWGSYCEYTADIDYIPADCTWKGSDHPAEDAMFLWGPAPPPDFIANHEFHINRELPADRLCGDDSKRTATAGALGVAI
jgi:catechol 2,3-dioxygenase